MKSKKAVIEVGFSWIFILIAGAVILGLFVYIGVNQGNFFKNLLNANLLTDLNAIFIGAQVSKNTAASFEIPKTELSFDCDSYGIEGITHPIEGTFVFGPKSMETSELISWSKPWSLGYRITNFLYITSPFVKYYIAYDSQWESLANEIYDDLPSQVTKELFPLDGTDVIEDENYDKMNILVVGKSDSYKIPSNKYDKDDFRSDEVTFIYLIDQSALTDEIMAGTVMFLDGKQEALNFDLTNGNKADFYDLSSLYGALISGNNDLWRCIMRRAYKKAAHVNHVYGLRTVTLELNSMSPVCTIDYKSIVPVLNTMADHLVKQENGDPGVNIEALRGDIVSIDNYNVGLERRSCPLIY